MIRMLMVCVALALPAAAQPGLPQIAPRTPYGDARAALLAAGWQPLRDPEADRCTPTDRRCAGRPEMVACAGTGMAQCLFAWQRGGLAIEVITTGEDAQVTGVRLR